MLAELVEYCLTPCPAYARRLGYLGEAVAIRARARRCRTAWRPHLERCQAFVREAMAHCSRRDTALVIGSGALLDIPLEALAGSFRRVILADVVHPLSARWRAWRLPNVRLETVDVTGVLHQLPGLPSPTPLALFMDAAPDFTLSANILSQLPLLPLARLEKTGRFTPDELDRAARDILQGHLDWLRGLPGTVCLITDVEWRTGDRVVRPLRGLEQWLACVSEGGSGEMERGLDFRTQGILPEGLWTWNIAPKPEAHPEQDVIHRVRACMVRASCP